MSNASYEKAKASIDKSLHKLKTDYLDLMLIHQPFGDYYGAYRAMEEAYKEGKLRAIGVSNFYPDRLIDLCQFAEIAPMVNQVETHVFQQQRTAHEYMKKYGVQHEAWGPFAEGKKNCFTNPVLVEIGEKYGKTAAQTALRFLIQSDVVVIPKSTHKERMEQNLDVFDFSLSEADMEAIRTLERVCSLTITILLQWKCSPIWAKRESYKGGKPNEQDTGCLLLCLQWEYQRNRTPDGGVHKGRFG